MSKVGLLIQDCLMSKSLIDDVKYVKVFTTAAQLLVRLDSA